MSDLELEAHRMIDASEMTNLLLPSSERDMFSDVAEVAREYLRLRESVQKAVAVGIRYGQIDGSHHRLWVIDQMLRELLGKEYDEAIAENCDESCGWDTGIAP